MRAVMSGDVHAVNALLQRPDLDINASDAYGCTALMHASADGNYTLFNKLFYDQRTDVSLKDERGFTAYDYAQNNNHDLITDEFVRKSLGGSW